MTNTQESSPFQHVIDSPEVGLPIFFWRRFWYPRLHSSFINASDWVSELSFVSYFHQHRGNCLLTLFSHYLMLMSIYLFLASYGLFPLLFLICFGFLYWSAFAAFDRQIAHFWLFYYSMFSLFFITLSYYVSHHSFIYLSLFFATVAYLLSLLAKRHYEKRECSFRFFSSTFSSIFYSFCVIFNYQLQPVHFHCQHNMNSWAMWNLYIIRASRTPYEGGLLLLSMTVILTFYLRST